MITFLSNNLIISDEIKIYKLPLIYSRNPTIANMIPYETIARQGRYHKQLGREKRLHVGSLRGVKTTEELGRNFSLILKNNCAN